MDSILEALIIHTGTPPDGIAFWVTMKNSIDLRAFQDINQSWNSNI
jgi:hypothetical protein